MAVQVRVEILCYTACEFTVTGMEALGKTSGSHR